MNRTDSTRPAHARPLAPWVGGKRGLARHLVARIAAIPHRLYAEPFVGMGGVFLRRPSRATVEAINDGSRDVATLFRVVRHHPEALLSEMRLQLVSRDDFRRLLAVPPESLTDIQRTARFVALQRMAYGGKPDCSSFPVRPSNPKTFDAGVLRSLVEAAHDRLARVTIECLDFQEFIERYDRPEGLFYLDPPYFGCENYYGKGLFVRSDFERLAALLARTKARWLMSLNDHLETRRLFGAFAVEEVPVTYQIGGPKPVVELVVSSNS